MAKLVINDPETGERIGTLVIPEGATHEQIVAAGAQVLAEHRARRAANGGGKEAAPVPSRELLCQLCRHPIPEDQLAAHVEVEQRRMLQIEMAEEAKRGRR